MRLFFCMRAAALGCAGQVSTRGAAKGGREQREHPDAPRGDVGRGSRATPLMVTLQGAQGASEIVIGPAQIGELV